MYLSDIQWFDYHQGIYEINNRKELKNLDSPNSKSLNASYEHFKSSVSEPIDSQIKAMLLNTQIINEEFYQLTKNSKEEEAKESQNNKNFSTKNSGNINFHSKGRHYSSCNLSDYLNNTFLNSNCINIFEENKNYRDSNERNEESENTKTQMKKCLFHYKGITEKIEQHLKDKPNFILAEILQIFNFYFYNKYSKAIAKTKESHPEKSHRKKMVESIEGAFQELRDFIKCFYTAVSSFYKLEEYQRVLKYFLFTKENLQNFLTSIIFNEDNQIYELVFQGQSFIDQEIEKEFKEKMALIKDCEPHDFEVSDIFCLNEKTVKFFSDKKRNKTVDNKENMLQSQLLTETLMNNETEQTKQSTILTNSKFLFELKESCNQKSFPFDNCEEETCKVNEKKFFPYLKAIKNLKKIQKLKSPLHKLKNLRITAEIIEQEIKEFYHTYGIDFENSVGKEELLHIHIYIISKADIQSLFTQCAIIDKFLSSNLDYSIANYYLSTMQVSLKLILSLKGSDLN